MVFFFDGITAFLSYQVFETASFVLQSLFVFQGFLNAVNVFCHLNVLVSPIFVSPSWFERAGKPPE
jgi:hypothetical protein